LLKAFFEQCLVLLKSNRFGKSGIFASTPTKKPAVWRVSILDFRHVTLPAKRFKVKNNDGSALFHI